MSGRPWTYAEVKKIVEYADKGYSNEHIAKLIGRSVSAVKNKRRLIDKDMMRLKYGCEKENMSLCWLCRKACTEQCRKLVEGFRATPIIVGQTNKISYIVKACPQYDEEDYVKQYINKFGRIDL